MATQSSEKYKEIWYQSDDGLRLYARDYSNTNASQTLLCMHGLSRNSADFEELCETLCDDYRIIAVDQRGRGRSEYDSNFDNYQVPVYAQDMLTLVKHLDLKNVVLVGTSMGGLISMVMNALCPNVFSGIVLNDIGPDVDPKGLDRIKAYVGKTKIVNSWQEAIDQVKQINGPAFPNFNDTDWRAFVGRLYVENESGAPVLAYDANISKAMSDDDSAAVPPDLWPLFEATTNMPLLLIRGELSDILHSDCVKKMQQKSPSMDFFEVADVGHAPILNEPGAVDAIRSLISGISVAH